MILKGVTSSGQEEPRGAGSLTIYPFPEGSCNLTERLGAGARRPVAHWVHAAREVLDALNSQACSPRQSLARVGEPAPTGTSAGSLLALGVPRATDGGRAPRVCFS